MFLNYNIEGEGGGKDSRTKRKKLIAVQDFQAKDRKCVNLVRDEVVKEIETDKDGWTKVKKDDGSKGLVKTAVLKPKGGICEY